MGGTWPLPSPSAPTLGSGADYPEPHVLTEGPRKVTGSWGAIAPGVLLPSQSELWSEEVVTRSRDPKVFLSLSGSSWPSTSCPP